MWVGCNWKSLYYSLCPTVCSMKQQIQPKSLTADEIVFTSVTYDVSIVYFYIWVCHGATELILLHWWNIYSLVGSTRVSHKLAEKGILVHVHVITDPVSMTDSIHPCFCCHSSVHICNRLVKTNTGAGFACLRFFQCVRPSRGFCQQTRWCTIALLPSYVSVQWVHWSCSCKIYCKDYNFDHRLLCSVDIPEKSNNIISSVSTTSAVTEYLVFQ